MREATAAYDRVVEVIDRVKTDEDNLDTDAYAAMIFDAIRQQHDDTDDTDDTKDWTP